MVWICFHMDASRSATKVLYVVWNTPQDWRQGSNSYLYVPISYYYTYAFLDFREFSLSYYLLFLISTTKYIF